MRITYVTAARGVGELRMDMETDVKTEIALQDVSCKKNNAIVILFITLCHVEGHQLGVLSV
jgi:hypothetical protein